MYFYIIHTHIYEVCCRTVDHYLCVLGGRNLLLLMSRVVHYSTVVSCKECRL